MNVYLKEAVFWPLVPACASQGIGKTRAYQLASSGAIETVLIGCRRYVLVDSLLSLPRRLAAQAEAGGSL